MVAARRPATASFSLASRAARVRRSMVMSRKTMTTPVSSPASLRMGAPLSSMAISEPSLRMRMVWLAMPTTRLRRCTLVTGFSTGWRVVSLTMWKTSSSGRPRACGLEPAGEFLSDGVHHLDLALGVAGDDSVADGGEGGAQVLLGLEELLGAAALQVERCGGRRRRHVLEAVAGEEADDKADDQGEHNQDDEHMACLPVPLGDAVAAALLGDLDDLVEQGAHGVHPGPAGEVDVVVVGAAAGGDDGDDGFGEALMPGLVLLDEAVEDRSVSAGPAMAWSCGDGLLHGGFGIVVGLKEARVGGDLIAAQAGLFVDDEGLD